MSSASARSLVTLTLLGSLALVACSPARVNIAQVDSAHAAKDEVFLDKVCSGALAAAASAKQVACERRDQLQGKANVMRASCAELPDLAETLIEKGVYVEHEAAERAIACGNWAWVFESLVWLPTSRDLLRDLEARKHPVGAELDKYAASHRGPAFLPAPRVVPKNGEAQRGGFARWLVDQRTKHCASISEAALGATPFAREVAMHYVAEVRCKEGQRLALEALADPGLIRVDACEWLGALGDATTLEKVKAVGEGDSYTSRDKSGVLGFPVRSTCMDAATRIRLRK
ncbi:MAG: hypothetical protein JST00_26395 [Deltaproteobacteria bacterium]|nr:hypothetical protein [Deltaproteobacteria bacterium]